MSEAEALEVADLVSLKAELTEWIETIDENPDQVWSMLLTGLGKSEKGGSRSITEFEETGREIRPDSLKAALIAGHAWVAVELIKRGVT